MNVVWTRLADAKPPHYPGPYLIWKKGWLIGVEGWLKQDGTTWVMAMGNTPCSPTHWAPMPKPPINP